MGSGSSSGKPTTAAKPVAVAEVTSAPAPNLVSVKPIAQTETEPPESPKDSESLPTNVVQVTQVQVKQSSQTNGEPERKGELERKGSTTIVSNMLEQMEQTRQDRVEQSRQEPKEKAPGGTHLAGAGFRPASSSGRNGNLRAGQAVRIVGLENARYLNGKQGVLRNWDEDLGRWVVRLANGEEKGIRSQNLSGLQDNMRSGSTTFANDVSDSANKELEGLLLQTNWSAIYQLFYQRFGIAVLDKIERGSVVKAAVEMSLSIVAKCFALLRSDPGGRLHCTPLHIAALQSSTEAAEVIVRDLPKLVEQTHKPSHSALCPLHIAILCGGQAIVELLLEGRADPNVRTLHDICPIHLAATTSKDLCQALISYNAEPMRRDVMGSTAMHYAAAFKQQPVVDLFVSNSANSVKLASEADQKRVTPIHIACALYAGEEDLATSMSLLSSGAKPRQVDVSGAAAWDVVPWSQNCLLTKFFETHSNDMQSAAQEWMDKFHESQEQAELDNSRQPEVDDHTPHAHDEQAQRPAELSSSRKLQREEEASRAVDAEQAKGEIQRLKKEHAAELERLKQDLLQKEQSIAKQQQSFEALQKLHEDTRNQTKTQLEDMQKRNADERADWMARLQSQVETAREEAHADGMKQAGEEAKQQLAEQQRAFDAKREKLEEEILRAKRSPSKDMLLSSTLAGGSPQATLSPPGLGATARRNDLGSTFTDFGAKLNSLRPAGSEESKNQIAELTEEVKRLEDLYVEEQALRNKEVKDLQDQFQRAQEAMQEEKAGYQNRRAEGDAETEKLRGENTAKQAEIKSLTDQLRQSSEQSRQLQEEISRMKVESEDKYQQLARERQDAESKGTAAALAFETKLSDMEMLLSNGRSELEAGRARIKAAEAQAAQMQPTISRLNEQIKALEIQFAEEQVLRKKFHNQIQDMKGAIRVFCRFRPMVDRETKAGDTVAAKKVDAFTAEVHPPDKRAGQHEASKAFSFDSVFDADSSQEDVFADCRELVQSAVDGYNVTIFAYGQTGAGKTWTMYGSDANPGLAPRSIQALFSVIEREQRRGNKTFKVKAYMIEVYKQDIIDLLSDKPPQQNSKNHGLEVKKDIGRGMMYVEGVTERDIRTPQELKQVLVEGEKKRHVAATKMNSASSRSHLLLSIIVECNIKEPEQVVYGKITLCDLAGSERPKKSEVSGDGLKEAIEINKSLTALGDVIEALTKGSKSVPYRNHKLTMLMQDSLGGTAKTLMFVNCSPAGSNSEETVTSLKWASRARQITNDVKKNADSKEVARLKQVIAMMSQAQDATEDKGDDDATNLRSGLGMVS